MTATFRPRKNGRPVKLQRQKGRRWVTVARARQRQGRAEFTAPYAGGGATYRVLATRYRGLRPVKSRGVSTNMADAEGFTDDFTGDALDFAKWNHKVQDYGPTRTCTRGSDEAVTVADGRAMLSVRNDPDRPGGLLDTRPDTCKLGRHRYEWRINGHISTEFRHTLKYGYAAARIKFHQRRGQHAAFWMMPADPAADEGSARLTGAEIDVVEWFGEKHPQGAVSSFIYHWPDDRRPGRTPVQVGGFIKRPSAFGRGWADRYHVFSVEWTPKRYVFRIDGKESFRTSKGVSGQEEFLILSLLPSDWELHHLGSEKRLPQTMSVDWVRTWQR